MQLRLAKRKFAINGEQVQKLAKVFLYIIEGSTRSHHLSGARGA